MDFQWYPGHMTKAKRMMQENMKLIDIMIELVDARIPLSSRNPDIDQLAANKSRLILLNKTDMADERVTAQWKNILKKRILCSKNKCKIRKRCQRYTGDRDGCLQGKT